MNCWAPYSMVQGKHQMVDCRNIPLSTRKYECWAPDSMNRCAPDMVKYFVAEESTKWWIHCSCFPRLLGFFSASSNILSFAFFSHDTDSGINGIFCITDVDDNAMQCKMPEVTLVIAGCAILFIFLYCVTNISFLSFDYCSFIIVLSSRL